MNPTNSTKPQLGTKSNSLPPRGHNLPPVNAQAPEVNKAELSKVQDLAGGSQSKKSIHNRQPEVKQEKASGLSKYELLASLPTELIAAIVSYLNQEDLCQFFYSISQDLITSQDWIAIDQSKLEDQPKAYAKTGILEDRPCEHWSLRLLDVFLREISGPIDFDHDMSVSLEMAKRLGLREVLSKVPSMRIDFKYSQLSYNQVRELFKKMSIGVKQLELYGIDKKEIDFSTKYFPRLESLKVGHSKSLESLEVDDESGVLKELNIDKCPYLKTIDIQYSRSLNRLDCLGLVSLEAIKMVEKNQLKELTLKDCDLDNLDLYNLASFLSESCVKLNLKASTVKDPTSIKQFISKLRQLREVALTDLECLIEGEYPKFVISLKDFFRPVCLERINLTNVELNLEGACEGTLKELHLNQPSIHRVDCLRHFPNLESLERYSPNSNEEFAATLASLKKLKRLTVNCSDIDDFQPLGHLVYLEELVLLKADALSQESVAVFSNFTKLKKLHIQNNARLETLDFLMDLKNLEELSLVGCNVLPESFRVLECLTKLKRLDLKFTKIENLGFLKALPDLEVLTLNNCYKLIPNTFVNIALLRNLKQLNLQDSCWGFCHKGSPISLEFLKELVQLEELDLGDGFKLSQENCAFLIHLKNLKKLNLCQAIALKHINFLAELTKLEDLNLKWCRQLKGEDLAVLNCLTKLRRLNLDGIFLGSLTVFEGLKHLEYINLEGTTAFNMSSPELAVFPSACTVDGLRWPSYYQTSLPRFSNFLNGQPVLYSDSSEDDFSDSD